ncbi:MAG: hypothetical protein ACRDA7_03365 [Metamycoplasmataceae bacterium]
MIKKIILGSCLATGVISAAALTTVFTLVPIKKNFASSRNLKITSYSGIINISQEDFEAMISVTNSLEERIAALSKLFEGVNETNILNIIVEETSDFSIILNAKNDYYFDHENIKSITGNYKITEIINITPKEGIISIIQDDVNLIFSQVNSTADKVVALSKLFDGVTEENFVNFKIEKTSDTVITLKANEGYAFGLDALSSIKVNIKIDSILNITPKPGIINITNEDIVSMISIQNTPEKIASLSKLFDGVDNKNIANVIAEKTSDTVITLKAQNGYTFGSTTITAITANIKVITVLNIKPKTVIDNITEADVESMISTTNTPIQKATALSKLFDGVTESNVNNFTSVKTSVTTITLTAKDGYVFGQEGVASIKANINVVTILNITPKKETINVTNADIVAMVSLTNVPAKTTALSKLFDGINEKNAINVAAEKTSEKIITLKANNGFSFNSTTTVSIMANINIVTILNITPKKTTGNITEADIQAMMSPTNSGKERAEALSKLFDGVTEGNVASFTVERPSKTVIVLKANLGFAFGDLLVNSIGADINKVIEILNIKAKTGTINILQTDLDAINSNTAKEKVEGLLKLFDGVTEENLNNFKIVKNPSSITLTANDGFALGFITTTSITTNFKIITILNISVKEGSNNISQADILDMVSLSNTEKRVAALSKIFNGITKENSVHIRAENTSNTQITLIANDGYAFVSIDVNSIKADVKIISFLNISPKAKTVDVSDADIAEMISTSNTAQQRAEALSKIFDGVTAANVVNVKAEKTSGVLITLNSMGNYLFDFNSSSTITANIRIITILNIIPKTGIINITQEDINVMSSTSNPVANRAEALLKLFSGITVSNVVNVNAVKTSDTEITLNSNEGFSFGSIGNNSIKASIKIITILNITALPDINNATQEDIDAMVSTSNSAKQRAEALSKLYKGVTEANVVNIKVGKPNSGEITLTANEGYAFNIITSTSLKSFFRLIVILNISPKEGVNRISEADYNTISISNNPDAKAASLSILFNGVSGYDFTENRYSISIKNNIFTLTANLGYVFGSMNSPSVQSSFKLIKILNLKGKTGTVGLSQTETFIIKPGSTSSVSEKIRVLNKVFDGGITTENFNYFTIGDIPAPPSKSILIAKDGYAFGSANITSIETKIIINSWNYFNVVYNGKINNTSNNLNTKKELFVKK